MTHPEGNCAHDTDTPPTVTVSAGALARIIHFIDDVQAARVNLPTLGLHDGCFAAGHEMHDALALTELAQAQSRGANHEQEVRFWIGANCACPHYPDSGLVANALCCGRLRALLRAGDFAGFGRAYAAAVAMQMAGESPDHLDDAEAFAF